MDLSFFLELVKEFGYFSMFVFNWVLLFGMPIPNEVAAAFSGVLTEISYFRPLYAFISAYLGLISSNTFAYFIGFVFGKRLIVRLERTRLRKPIQNFNGYLKKKGKWAIALSFFLPGVRWAMPYVLGANRFHFGTYVLYAYPAGMIWMLIYFNLGRTFPYAYQSILSHLQVYLISATVIIVASAAIHFYVKNKKKHA